MAEACAISLADFQSRFAAGICGEADVNDLLTDCPRVPREMRFAVYRNNVHVSLVDALAASFPAVQRMVGDDFFRGAARVFLSQGLPQQASLIGYGESFPAFLAAFEPARGLTYLPFVARLELAWLAAYHAADAVPLVAADFAAVPGDAMAALRFELHPSLQLVESPMPVLELWRRHIEDEVIAPMQLAVEREVLMVLRPEAQVVLHALSAGEAAMLRALAQGASLGAAADAAAPHSGFDLTQALLRLISGGVLTAFQFPEG
ncbi:MAG: DUF2063 domain-containing protein [Rhizobiales bacterium]|nr:DUF2063 domain-containing protein [Hyphomicrobiales bacterium]